MNVPTRDSRTDGLPVWAQWRDGALLLLLHVQPGARRTALAGIHGGRLKIALRAPPVDGKANAALLHYLADTLQLRRTAVSLSAGPASREKSVAIACDPASAPGLVAQLQQVLDSEA